MCTPPSCFPIHTSYFDIIYEQWSVSYRLHSVHLQMVIPLNWSCFICVCDLLGMWWAWSKYQVYKIEKHKWKSKSTRHIIENEWNRAEFSTVRNRTRYSKFTVVKCSTDWSRKIPPLTLASTRDTKYLPYHTKLSRCHESP